MAVDGISGPSEIESNIKSVLLKWRQNENHFSRNVTKPDNSIGNVSHETHKKWVCPITDQHSLACGLLVFERTKNNPLAIHKYSTSWSVFNCFRITAFIAGNDTHARAYYHTDFVRTICARFAEPEIFRNRARNMHTANGRETNATNDMTATASRRRMNRQVEASARASAECGSNVQSSSRSTHTLAVSESEWQRNRTPRERECVCVCRSASIHIAVVDACSIRWVTAPYSVGELIQSRCYLPVVACFVSIVFGCRSLLLDAYSGIRLRSTYVWSVLCIHSRARSKHIKCRCLSLGSKSV